MKNTTLLLIALLCFSNCVEKSETPNRMKKQLRHIVLFKFKKEATPETIKNIENEFIALPSKIETIKDFEWGLNNSPEGLNKGLTHCFFVTFDTEEGRATYLPHPAHKAFVSLLGAHLEDVLVLDYWTK
jgi:hypothetical protein